MYVIAGLGNPGLKYNRTRHNVGFEAIDLLVEKYGVTMKDNRAKGLVGSCTIDGKKVVLLKPMTYMNASGSAVRAVLDFYKADPTRDLIVLSDDVSLSAGMIRIRPKGSAGGHNGLKDIIAKCGTEEFLRIKIGVGEKPEGKDLVRYVLGRPNRWDRKRIEGAYEHAAEAIPMLLAGEIDRAMSIYNAKNPVKKA